MQKRNAIYIIVSLFLCLAFSMPTRREQAYKAHYKGTLYFGEGDYRKAERLFQRAYSAFPDNFNFAMAYGLCIGRQGNTEKGKEVIERATKGLYGSSPLERTRRAIAFFLSGSIAAYAGQYDQAASSIGRSISLLPDSAGISNVFENAMGYLQVMNQGSSAHQRQDLGRHLHVHRRDLKRAQQHFERALRIQPDYAIAWHNYKRICDTLGTSPSVPAVDTNRAAADRRNTFTKMHQRLSDNLHLTRYRELLFLVDVSGSMVQERVVCMDASRFDVMRELSGKILSTLRPEQRLGIGTIGGICGSEPDLWIPTGSIDPRELSYKFRFLIPDGTTPLLSTLQRSAELFTDSIEGPKSIFLISDGANICTIDRLDICEWAKELGKSDITINVMTFLNSTFNNTDAFAEYICLAENTGGQILYMDNYRCQLQPFRFDLVPTCQFTLPRMEKSDCWGPSVKNLWMIFSDEQ